MTPNNVRIEYETFGDSRRPPLLLIQGLGAHMIGWHADFCKAIVGRGYYVIRFDNRDVGLSEKFPDSQYGLADMASDTAGLLDFLDVEAAHIVGQSMGGMIAQRLAIDFPSRVLSLGLIYTTPNRDHLVGAQTLSDRSTVPRATTREEAIANYLVNEAPCAGPDYPHDEGWLRELGGLMYDRNYDPEAIDRQLHVITTLEDLLPDLAQVGVPTLLIHGDSDALISATGSEAIHSVLPHSKLEIYPGMGHQLPRSLWPDIISHLAENASYAHDSRAAPNL